MMQRLEMNFQKPANPPRRIAGWFLLFVGLTLQIEMGVTYFKLKSDRDTMSHMVLVSKPRSEVPGETPSYKKFTDKDFEVGQQIITRLSAPWDAFFSGLESVNNEQVAILSIDPDIQSGLLSINGEAKNYATVLNIIAQLRTTKPFSEVFLTSHEIKRDDPQHPVSFSVSMRWMRPL
jgi:hypothetical protein